ncbi:hypothetical protein NTG1052_370067 [Candidatus Nitrotoga sp. 1052]|nr:hypothetical protein NTG1052_370067 [Candidatus Nitrotoga sp. 1052]
MQDIFIVCVDGLKGFPEAIEAVYPRLDPGSGKFHCDAAALKFMLSNIRFIKCIPPMH